MSDRLKDLQRQRALAQEQLAWLDREIARETATPATRTPALPAVATGRPARLPAAPSAKATDTAADEIIAQYQHPGHSIHQETRRGCLIYFFAAFGLVGLGLLVLYFSHRR